MKLELFRTLWGIDEPWGPVYPRLRELGYAGVEAALYSMSPDDRRRMREELDGAGLDLVTEVLTCGLERRRTVDEHLRSFREEVTAAAALRPRFINAHSGSDAWSLADALRFYREALRIEADLGVVVAHETHRTRVMFNPFVTRELLAELPALRLTCDFSHWVVVCERLLEDQLDVIRMAADHCHHVHARVGYPEGPQVADPRAPVYAEAVRAHDAWWDLCWDAQERRGHAISTLTAEYGPPDYLHAEPFTGKPLADLWEICEWQARRQAARFAARGAEARP